MLRLFRRFLSTSLILLMVGCVKTPQTDYSQVNLQSVTGRVKLDGQPLADAVVTFNDIQDGTFSYALTDDEGRFRLRFDSQMEGCKPGQKRVEVSTSRKILGLNSTEEGGDTDAARTLEKVPDKYHKKSQLIVQVSPDEREFDLDLVSR